MVSRAGSHKSILLGNIPLTQNACHIMKPQRKHGMFEISMNMQINFDAKGLPGSNFGQCISILVKQTGPENVYVLTGDAASDAMFNAFLFSPEHESFIGVDSLKSRNPSARSLPCSSNIPRFATNCRVSRL